MDESLPTRLARERDLPGEDLLRLIAGNGEDDAELFALADAARRRVYGRDVFLRGLVEFTSVCRNDCRYCGLRRSNAAATRYRLSEEEILSCCGQGHALGFRTFVLQGGEDPGWGDARLAELVKEIRRRFPDCVVTLSVGERPRAAYEAFFAAGARRYLLRHETADAAHYAFLHPEEMSLPRRMRCLFDLKELGFQVGSGFMVGSPGQTPACLVEDLRFLQRLDPDMIGIGPFVHHAETPFAREPNGSVALTLRLVAMLRLMFPHALIPATTALGTLDAEGREKGLRAGANVLMPNLSPVRVRKAYSIYDGKICTGEEAAECRACLARRVAAAGYRVVTDPGDVRRG